MNINSLSVLLGCAGLLMGGIGLAAYNSTGPDRDVADAERLQTARAANWPPDPSAAGVEFHNEMVALLTPRTPARAQQARAEQRDVQNQDLPPESGTTIKSIRSGRVAGSRRTQFYEIEFLDGQGRQIVRRYGLEQGTPRNRGERQATPPETYGYSPRRSRRERSRQYRR